MIRPDIQKKLDEIKTTKSKIRFEIIEHGVPVPESTVFKMYPDKIAEIPKLQEELAQAKAELAQAKAELVQDKAEIVELKSELESISNNLDEILGEKID